MTEDPTPEPTLDEIIAGLPNTPEPAPPEAVKLPPAYDTCLIGATVEPYGPDRFAYSLKKLTKFLMKEYDCEAPEARHILAKNFLLPHAATICFVADELMLGAVEDDKKIQIVTSGAFGKKKKP